MASKKKTAKKAGGKKPGPDAARAREERRITKELSSTGDIKSQILRDEVGKRIQKHTIDSTDDSLKKKPAVFYRNFVFRCMKCMKEFKHEDETHSPSSHVKCPNCDHEHRCEIEQQGTIFEIEFPQSIKVVADLSKK